MATTASSEEEIFDGGVVWCGVVASRRRRTLYSWDLVSDPPLCNLGFFFCWANMEDLTD